MRQKWSLLFLVFLLLWSKYLLPLHRFHKEVRYHGNYKKYFRLMQFYSNKLTAISVSENYYCFLGNSFPRKSIYPEFFPNPRGRLPEMDQCLKLCNTPGEEDECKTNTINGFDKNGCLFEICYSRGTCGPLLL